MRANPIARIRFRLVYNIRMIEKLNNVPNDFNPGRRLFLKEAVSALLLTSIPGIDALGSVLDQYPDLAQEILDLQKKLSPQGEYFKALHSEDLSSKKILEIVDKMDAVATRLRTMHFGAESRDQAAGKYIISQKIPGLLQLQIPTSQKRLVDGVMQSLVSLCNGFVIRAQGTARWVTAYHCVEGTLREHEFNRQQSNGADLATRRLDNYHGPALTFDGHTTADSISGAIGVTIGEKNGIEDAFYSPLVPMTPAVYHYMFAGEELGEPFESQVRNSMWKVLPPEQGRKINGRFVSKGRSGSIEIAYEPRRRGYTPAGVYFAIAVPTQGPLKGKTIGFVSKPDSLTKLFDSDEAQGRFANPALKLRQ